MTSLTKTGTALLTVLLAVGCGGGSSSAKDTPPSKASATTAAAAINLKKADVPTAWKSEAADNSDNGSDSTDKQIATCLGLPASDTTDVVDINSDDFSTGQAPLLTSVNSEVEVVGSLAQASRLKKAFASDKAEGCLKAAILKEAKDDAGDTPGVKFETPTVTKKTVPSGVDGGFAFDVTVPFTVQGATLKVNVSIIGFYVKHTGITLQTTTLGTPAADYDQNALLNKLVDRAKSSAV